MKIPTTQTLVLLSVLLLSSHAVVYAHDDDSHTIDLSVLGTNSLARFRPGWSLTVNDQCHYEFVFQFEHDEALPRSDNSMQFAGPCRTEDPRRFGGDGMLWLEPRQHFQGLPEYVQATIGFNHMALDWRACGEEPRGYNAAGYEFSFYRPTPEYRAAVMNCTLATGTDLLPGAKVCDTQNQPNTGKQFLTVPRSFSGGNFNTPMSVVNVPSSFTTYRQQSAVPHVGLRQWDLTAPPAFPQDWNYLALEVATYDGDLSMVRVKVPYSTISYSSDARDTPPWLSKDQFHSIAAQYHDQTIETLPDTFSIDYEQDEDIIRFTMLGKAGMCRSDFEKAQSDAGGKPFFPNYDEVEAVANETGGGTNTTNDKSEAVITTVVGTITAMTTAVLFMALQ